MNRTSLAAALLAATLGTLAGCGSGPTLSPAAEPSARPAALYARSLKGAAAVDQIERITDAADRDKLYFTLSLTRNTAPVGWRNATSGRDFVLAPLNAHAGNHGPCRDFQLDVTSGNSTERLMGTACQANDNRWRLER